jgi:hypothetical protein
MPLHLVTSCMSSGRFKTNQFNLNGRPLAPVTRVARQMTHNSGVSILPASRRLGLLDEVRPAIAVAAVEMDARHGLFDGVQQTHELFR